jgi:hypothetical protein
LFAKWVDAGSEFATISRWFEAVAGEGFVEKHLALKMRRGY